MHLHAFEEVHALGYALGGLCSIGLRIACLDWGIDWKILNLDC
jgi:hypothetical protein